MSHMKKKQGAKPMGPQKTSRAMSQPLKPKARRAEFWMGPQVFHTRPCAKPSSENSSSTSHRLPYTRPDSGGSRPAGPPAGPRGCGRGCCGGGGRRGRRSSALLQPKPICGGAAGGPQGRRERGRGKGHPHFSPRARQRCPGPALPHARSGRAGEGRREAAPRRRAGPAARGEGAAPAGSGSVQGGEAAGPSPRAEKKPGRERGGPQEQPPGCHRQGRGAPAVTLPPGSAPPPLRGRAAPSAAEGGAERGPPEAPRRQSRRSMAGAESRRPPAPDEDVKPFTPEKTKEIVMSLQQPAVFCNMVGDWPALHWNVKHLSAVLEGRTVQFRLGLKTVNLVPQFETSCSYVEAKLEEFLAWSCGQPSCLSGPFSCYDYSKYWAYADYKYIARIFEDKPEIFQDVRWSDFGFPGRSGKESTLWIGSEGANTPCHLDSYGCNLVLQVQGRKRWHLFPPGDTSFLYPTRIPYEESSIFSKVNIANPDLKRFPEFRNSTAHVVTLSPGQDEDHEARVEEAITRMLVCAIKSAEKPSDGDLWLNPTEVEATSHEINLQYLNEAVSAYLKCQETSVSGQAHSSSTGAEQKTNTSCKRKRREVGCEPGGCTLLTQDCATTKAEELQKIPFGPHLIQVLPQSHKTNVMGAVAVESDSRDLHENEGEHFGNLHCKRKRLLMSNDCETAAHQMGSDCSSCTPQTALSTNDLLDCLVNPRVISLVAQLLLERTRV
uniref:HSPB1 associated protein 1 n=1 Tax=Corvus moneduloides TaxID=1196302 RepID=A0A8C3DN18_CORMO